MGTDSFSSLITRSNDKFCYYWSDPRWPLLSPHNVQSHKCEKCPRDKPEFYSPFNFRRHSKSHRKNIEQEDLKKNRAEIAGFWNKLPCEEAAKILDVSRTNVDAVHGAKTTDALTRFPRHTSLVYPHTSYYRALPLVDAVQKKFGNSLVVTSEELFKALDEASENTFLTGGTSELVVRHITHGEGMKILEDEKNSLASFAFLVEENLVKAWNTDKNDKALRSLQALVDEEEAAEKQKAQKALEKKNKKKNRKNKLKKGSGESPPNTDETPGPGSDRSDHADTDKSSFDEVSEKLTERPEADAQKGDAEAPSTPADAENLDDLKPVAEEQPEQPKQPEQPEQPEKRGDEEEVVGRWADEVSDPEKAKPEGDGGDVKRSSKGPGSSSKRQQGPGFTRGHKPPGGGRGSYPMWRRSKPEGVRDAATEVGENSGKAPGDDDRVERSSPEPPSSPKSGDTGVFEQLFPHEMSGENVVPPVLPEPQEEEPGKAPEAEEVPNVVAEAEAGPEPALESFLRVGTLLIPLIGQGAEPPAAPLVAAVEEAEEERAEDAYTNEDEVLAENVYTFQDEERPENVFYNEDEMREFLSKRWLDVVNDPEAVILSLSDDEEPGDGGETPPEPGGGAEGDEEEGPKPPGGGAEGDEEEGPKPPGSQQAPGGVVAAVGNSGDETRRSGDEKKSGAAGGGAGGGAAGGGGHRKGRNRKRYLPKTQT